MGSLGAKSGENIFAKSAYSARTFIGVSLAIKSQEGLLGGVSPPAEFSSEEINIYIA